MLQLLHHLLLALQLTTGYLISMPNVYPTTATVWTDGAFVGVPNSGDYTHYND
jgi:hypothetical protein